jgi:WD40 repeat protein
MGQAAALPRLVGLASAVAAAFLSPLPGPAAPGLRSESARAGRQRSSIARKQKAGAVASLAYNPDDSLLAAGAYREVLLISTAGRRVSGRLSGHAGVVNAVVFSPDGRLLAAAGGTPSKEGEIRLWDWRARQLVRTIRAHTDTIYSLAFSPDGRLLAAGSYDHLVSLHSVDGLARAAPSMLKDHTDAVYSLAFSPDGSRLATAAGDRTVKVWDVSSGRRVYTLSESTAELYAVAYRPDGQQIAAGGVDRMIRVWDVTPSQGRLEQSAFAHDGALIRLAYSPDGATLVSAGEDRMVKTWDAADLTERYHLPEQPDWALALAIDRGGKRLAVGRFDGSVSLYDFGTGRLLRDLLGRA